MRIPKLLPLLVALAACSSSTDATVPTAFAGSWGLTEVDAQPIPVTHGATITAGQIEILNGAGALAGTGALEWCAIGGTPLARFEQVTWSVIDATRIRLTYPSWTGAAVMVDTATVSGDRMQLSSRMVTSLRVAGPSSETWTLTRLPTSQSFHC